MIRVTPPEGTDDALPHRFPRTLAEAFPQESGPFYLAAPPAPQPPNADRPVVIIGLAILLLVIPSIAMGWI